MSATHVVKGAEPWGATGDDVGVLVVHGFTGSPQSVRFWAEGIAGNGRTVTLPRLPGHGTTLADFARSTAADWVGEAEMHLSGLFERCRSVFVCGLSMGGTITLDIAERHSADLSGIVLVNAPVLSTDPREKLAPLLGRLPLFLKGIANDIAEPGHDELAYGKFSTKAAAQFIALRERVRSGLDTVSCPALLFTSRQDHVVPPKNGPYILERIASGDKELVYLEKSYHVATMDYDRDVIVARTNAFIAERTR